MKEISEGPKWAERPHFIFDPKARMTDPMDPYNFQLDAINGFLGLLLEAYQYGGKRMALKARFTKPKVISRCLEQDDVEINITVSAAISWLKQLRYMLYGIPVQALP